MSENINNGRPPYPYSNDETQPTMQAPATEPAPEPQTQASHYAGANTYSDAGSATPNYASPVPQSTYDSVQQPKQKGAGTMKSLLVGLAGGTVSALAVSLAGCLLSRGRVDR